MNYHDEKEKLTMITSNQLNSTDGISFEPPFHDMCAGRRAVITSLDGTTDYLFLTTMGLDQLPDTFIIDGARFSYHGVSDGQAYYREEEKERVEGEVKEVEEKGEAGKEEVVGEPPPTATEPSSHKSPNVTKEP